jgi:hypothetical protein
MDARSAEMKLIYLPTLSEMRDMLGDELYVKFVWMWREQEQDARARERRLKVFGVESRPAASFPTPMFSRASQAESSLAKVFQPARLRPNLVQDGTPVAEFEGVVEQIRPDASTHELDEGPRGAIAAASGRRR